MREDDQSPTAQQLRISQLMTRVSLRLSSLEEDMGWLCVNMERDPKRAAILELELEEKRFEFYQQTLEFERLRQEHREAIWFYAGDASSVYRFARRALRRAWLVENASRRVLPIDHARVVACRVWVKLSEGQEEGRA